MTDKATGNISQKAVRLAGAGDVPDEIMSLVGDARFVLIGEASHGTHEFYKSRAEITKHLIAEKNFSAVAVEADFPDAYRVNRYVRGRGNDRTANDALANFKRYPLWMWRNREVLEFVEWLREHNENYSAPDKKAGFYGLDLYSLHGSMAEVLKYLDRVDPEAARRARFRYSCFEDFGEDPQAYGYAASFDLNNACEKEVINQLVELQRRRAEYASLDGVRARDEFFFAEQNARLVKNAEEYYRQMFRGRVSSWNLRDRHMTETLIALDEHLSGEQNAPVKIVVWEHNSHLGDARATEMSERGEWNVGQLARKKYEAEICLLGYTTYAGTVTATSNWDEPAQLKKVRPALDGSYEKLFHDAAAGKNFFLNLRDENTKETLPSSLLERAVGVIYRPETERLSHYFKANLAEQFDGIIHFDETRALEPLDKVSSWTHDDLPETYPEGL